MHLFLYHWVIEFFFNKKEYPYYMDNVIFTYILVASKLILHVWKREYKSLVQDYQHENGASLLNYAKLTFGPPTIEIISFHLHPLKIKSIVKDKINLILKLED